MKSTVEKNLSNKIISHSELLSVGVKKMNVPFNGVKTTAHVQQNAEKLTMNSCFDCFFLVAAVNQTDGSI